MQWERYDFDAGGAKAARRVAWFIGQYSQRADAKGRQRLRQLQNLIVRTAEDRIVNGGKNGRRP